MITQRPPARGFTLIELLVVIVIVSIIIAMATLAINTGDPRERLQTEARRFTALLQLAQDSSLLNASEFGIRIEESSYQFVILQEGKWLPVTQNKSLRLRQLPDGMNLELELDYQYASLQSSVSKIGTISKVGEVEKFESAEEKRNEPHIYLLSSGEIAPAFMLYFTLPGIDPYYSVKATEDGDYEIEYHES